MVAGYSSAWLVAAGIYEALRAAVKPVTQLAIATALLP
jgi:hypothetical protein